MFFISSLRTTPIAPPFPEQFQTATEHHHYPPQSPERPISAASSSRQSSVDNLRDIVASIYQNIPDKTYPQAPILDSQLHSRPSTASRSRNDSYDDDENIRSRTPTQPLIYATVQPQQRQHSRQGSYADSVHSGSSSSTSRQSPVASLSAHYQQKYTPISVQQQDEKTSYRAPSVSSSRRSSDRFPPPPPPNIETLDLTTTAKPRSVASTSTRSSIYAEPNDVNRILEF